MERGEKRPSLTVVEGKKPTYPAVQSFEDLKQRPIVDISDIDFYAPHTGVEKSRNIPPTKNTIIVFPVKPRGKSA